MNTDQALSQASEADGGEDEFDAAVEALTDTATPSNDAGGDDDPADGNGSSDEPPAGDEPPANQGTSGDQPQGSSDDIWSSVPEAVRVAHQREIEQRDARAAELERRLREKGNELALARRTAPQQAGSSTPSEDQTSGNPPAVPPEQIQQLKEEYGEIAGPLITMIEAQQRQIAELAKPVQQLTASQQVQAEQANLSRLDELAPDWRDLATKPEFQTFRTNAPRMVREALDRNWDQIVDPEEAAAAFEYFRMKAGFTLPQAANQDPQPNPLAAKRERQLAAGRDSGSSGGAPVANQVPDDFDTAVDALLSNRRRA